MYGQKNTHKTMITFFEIQPEKEVDEVLQGFTQRTADDSTAYYDVDELEDIIDHFLEKGYITAAENAVNLGRTLHPNNTDIQYRQARLFTFQGKLDEALQLTTQIDDIDRKDLENMVLRGEILLRLNKHREAEALFDDLLKEELTDKELFCLEIAHVCIGVGYYDSAEKYLRIAHETNPKNLDIMLELAFMVQQNYENTEEAIDIYNQMIDIEPYSIEAWFNLGQAYMAQDKPDKAADAFDFVTAIDEKELSAWLQKANAYFENKNYQKALETYQIYFEKTDKKEFPLVYMGECYEEMEKYDKAIECYNKAIDLVPDYVDAYVGLSTCMLSTERFEDCLDYTDRVLRLDPFNDEVWVYRAEAFVALDKPEEAIIAYERALKLDNEEPETFIALGNLYLDKGDYYNALYCFQNANEIDDEIEKINLFFAVCYCKLQQFPLMLAHLICAILENNESYKQFLEFCPEVQEFADETAEIVEEIKQENKV